MTTGDRQVTFKTLFGRWKTYIYRLAMTIPEDGIAELDGREKVNRSKGTWPLWTLVFVLAFASISNLASRAAFHKNGIAANMVGAGMALMVPVLVHFAIKTKGGWQIALWAVSIIFALVSGTMQYLVYAPDGDFILGRYHLEALAFGYGVPLAECVLAAAAAVFSGQQIEESATREADESEKEFNQSMMADGVKHQRELDMIKAQAEADAMRISAEKSVPQSVPRDVPRSVSDGALTSGGTLSEEQQRKRIMEHLMNTGETGATAIAKATGIGRTTAYRRLNELVSMGRVVKVGSKFSPTIAPIPQIEIHTNGAAK